MTRKRAKPKAYDKGDIPYSELQTKIGELWRAMHGRCYNPALWYYKHYGGRGITVSDEFKNFYKFRDYLQQLPGYENYLKDSSISLDRIDNDKGYERGNLRFADKSTQSANKRNFNKTGYKGVTFRNAFGNYAARIGVGGKKINIGIYLTAIEAAMAYNQYIVDNNLPYPLNKIATEALKTT